MQPMTRSRILSLVFIYLFCVSAAGWAASSATHSRLAAVDALGAKLYRESGATGMVLVVVRGNQSVFHGYGRIAPGSNEIPTEDSTLRLCSLTKIFTADLLTKLVADKTVRLDDPLQQYAPTGDVVPERMKPITLLDLATHTAGLPRELGYAPDGTPHFTYPDFNTRWRWLQSQHLRSIPGTAAQYSNLGFDFLADALQQATHQQYAALLSDRTLKPLHMWNTTFFPNADQCNRLLTGARDQGPCTVTEETDGSSGLYSTAADMTTWLKYLLGSDGAGMPSQDAAAQAIYIQPASLKRQRGLNLAGEPTGVGLGWIQILPTDSPSMIVQKTGGGAGFQTYIAINRARRTAVFVALTSGRSHAHADLYGRANDVLLSVAGLPPLPAPQLKRVMRHRHTHRPVRRVAARIVR